VEIYRDRPREEWPKKPDGSVEMYTIALDLDALLKEAE
jgi:catechol 2,3-dioxygenase